MVHLHGTSYMKNDFYHLYWTCQIKETVWDNGKASIVWTFGDGGVTQSCYSIAPQISYSSKDQM